MVLNSNMRMNYGRLLPKDERLVTDFLPLRQNIPKLK